MQNEPFFHANQSSETIKNLLFTLGAKIDSVGEKVEVVGEKVDIVIAMSHEHKSELRRTREVLMKGIFEATGVRAPICIVSCDVVGAPPSPSPHPALFR